MINILLGVCIIAALCHFLGHEIDFNSVDGCIWEEVIWPIRCLIYLNAIMIVVGYMSMFAGLCYLFYTFGPF